MDTINSILEHELQAQDGLFDPKKDLEELERLQAEDLRTRTN